MRYAISKCVNLRYWQIWYQSSITKPEKVICFCKSNFYVLHRQNAEFFSSVFYYAKNSVILQRIFKFEYRKSIVIEKPICYNELAKHN